MSSRPSLERYTFVSDEEAFIRMIVENPADDAPRLIYADWLEERESRS